MRSGRAENEIESVSQKTLENIQSALQSEIARLQAQLEELHQSPLGRSLADDFEIRSVDGKQFDTKETRRKPGISHLLEKGPELLKGVGGFASTVSRDIVYSIGKSVGIKFKPWGAVNAAEVY